MRKLIAVTFGVLLIGCLAYLGHAASVYLETAEQVNRAKMDLMQEALVYDREAQARITHDWHHVAQDYLGKFERKRFGALFVASYKNPRWNAGILNEMHEPAREAMYSEIAEAGASPYSFREFDTHSKQDARISQLYALWHAAYNVHVCRVRAANALSMNEVRRVEDDLTAKKRALARQLHAAY